MKQILTNYPYLAIGCLAILVTVSACATSGAGRNRMIPVVLAVSVSDGQPPTTAQYASLHKALAPEIADRKLTIVQNLEAAQFVLAVRFVPDRFSDGGGHVTIIGMQPNRLKRGPSQSDQMKAEADAVFQRGTIY